VRPEKLDEALAILRRFEVDSCILGHFTRSRSYRVTWHGETVVDLSMVFLWRACPIDPTATNQPERRLTPLEISQRAA